MLKVNALSQAHLVRLLFEGGYSRAELAERAGLHYATVVSYVAHFRRVNIAYIDEYLPDSRGRLCVPGYKIGLDQPDMKRPKKPTPAQRQQATRNKRKSIEIIQLMAGPITCNNVKPVNCGSSLDNQR